MKTLPAQNSALDLPAQADYNNVLRHCEKNGMHNMRAFIEAQQNALLNALEETHDIGGMPILDCMDADELAEYQRHFRALAQYCATKRYAVTQRLAGKIQEAQKAEKICDSFYDKLPSDLKW